MTIFNRRARVSAAVGIALICGLLLIAAISGRVMPAERSFSSRPPTAKAASATVFKGPVIAPPVNCSRYADSYLTEKDAGKTVRLVETSRFGICLDEAKHPFMELDTSTCPIGHVSNWSLEGPNKYPVGFQAVAAGTCIVRNRDFWVQVNAVALE